MSGLSSISGLIAGFDTKGAVIEMLAPQRAQIDSIKQQQTNKTAKQDAFAQLNNSLLDLRNISTAMATSSGFFSYTASLNSSNAGVPAANLLDVSGTNAVSAGSHSIIVNQVAVAERLSSSAAAQDSTGTAASSDTAALGLSGSFQIQGTTITVNAADSLQDIAFNINQQNTGSTATGVTASVVKVTSSDYRLVLAADATGTTGFTLSGAALDVGGALANLNLGATGQANAYSTLAAATDAQVTIDGLTITRSTNDISDALTGVTLNLKQADPTTTVAMNIGVDTAAIRSNVQSFVDAYNTVQSFINTQFEFDAATGSNGILAGEPLLTSIQSNLSSSLLQAVPGLATDRNSLVMVGVEPDATGVLSINDTRFSNYLNNDVNAIRDVFVAQGSSTNNDLQFLVNGFNTPSGTYSVNVTQAAARATVTGTSDLSAGLGADETVTITETGSARQAVAALTTGQSQSSIINALNTEFGTVYTEKHQLGTALTVSGGGAATGATTFTALALGVAAGDTISISGTTRAGVGVSGSFSVLDPATDTLSDLLSSIQTAFNQQVTASIDATGNIVLTDSQGGDSQLAVNVTANNEGGGTLGFGADSVITEGRYTMGVEAVASGNGVQIQSKTFGAGAGFSIAQSVDGLGIVDQTVAGVDVAGTINGLAATASGQMLTGSTSTIDGMSILYSGTTIGAVGDIVLGVGTAARFNGLLDTFANPVLGLIQNSIAALQGANTSLDKKIADLEAQLTQKSVQLTQSFTAMEQAMATLQSSGSFLTQQINAFTSSKK